MLLERKYGEGKRKFLLDLNCSYLGWQNSFHHLQPVDASAATASATASEITGSNAGDVEIDGSSIDGESPMLVKDTRFRY